MERKKNFVLFLSIARNIRKSAFVLFLSMERKKWKEKDMNQLDTFFNTLNYPPKRIRIALEKC